MPALLQQLHAIWQTCHTQQPGGNMSAISGNGDASKDIGWNLMDQRLSRWMLEETRLARVRARDLGARVWRKGRTR